MGNGGPQSRAREDAGQEEACFLRVGPECQSFSPWESRGKTESVTQVLVQQGRKHTSIALLLAKCKRSGMRRMKSIHEQ